jgi:hypothetical protein
LLLFTLSKSTERGEPSNGGKWKKMMTIRFPCFL